MFYSLSKFASQFTAVSDGYVFYAYPKASGKLVTAEEYAMLIANWQRNARRITWSFAGLLVFGFLFGFLTARRELPYWAGGIANAFFIAGLAVVGGWLMQARFAPLRLVRDRPDCAPARSASELRAGISWPFAMLPLVLGGSVLIGGLLLDRGPWSGWAWWGVIQACLFIASSLYLSIQKLRDRSS